jgi:hypothetical protein
MAIAVTTTYAVLPSSNGCESGKVSGEGEPAFIIVQLLYINGEFNYFDNVFRISKLPLL